MHRSSLRRVLTALWGCWFVLLVNEPLLLHACPMHDGALVPVAGSMAAATPPPAPATHGAQGSGSAPDVHDAHGAHSRLHPGLGLAEFTGSDPVQHDGGSHHCSCLGHCASATTVALPQREAFAWLAGIIDLDDAPVFSARQVVRDVEHLLPFATAPPDVTRA